MMFYFFLPLGATFFLVFAHAVMHHKPWNIPTRIKIVSGLGIFSGIAGLLSLFLWGKLFTTITTPFISYVGQVIAAVCFIFTAMMVQGLRALVTDTSSCEVKTLA